MIVHPLPDPRLFKNDSGRNIRNAVIYEATRSKYYYPNHVTPHLLVANFKSAGHYRVNGVAATVSDQYFYFLNKGDELEITFQQEIPLETMLILFSDELIGQVINYECRTANGLLDNADGIKFGQFYVPAIPMEYDPAISRELNKLKSGGSNIHLESTLFDLLAAIWAKTGTIKADLDKINAKRKVTREEIYKRLLLAKLYMHDNFRLTLTVDDIARTACLNKFHFLKLFKNYYGVSPHHYLVRLKLEQAYSLLAAGQSGVMDVCTEVGFESQGTFANLFKRTYGIPPSQVLKKSKRVSPKFPNFE